MQFPDSSRSRLLRSVRRVGCLVFGFQRGCAFPDYQLNKESHLRWGLLRIPVNFCRPV